MKFGESILKKKKLNTTQSYGLTPEQVKEAEKYLNKDSLGALNAQESIPLYEMFIIGYSFEEIQKHYAQFQLGRIILTAAVNGWAKDRETLANSIYDRVKARLIKSTVEQVEFLTDLISVSAAENSEEVRKYLLDPKGNKPPNMRIDSLKEYKQVVDMLASIASTMKNNTPQKQEEQKRLPNKKAKELKQEDDDSVLLAELAEE
jgi:hypothetical protein